MQSCWHSRLVLGGWAALTLGIGRAGFAQSPSQEPSPQSQATVPGGPTSGGTPAGGSTSSDGASGPSGRSAPSASPASPLAVPPAGMTGSGNTIPGDVTSPALSSGLGGGIGGTGSSYFQMLGDQPPIARTLATILPKPPSPPNPNTPPAPPRFARGGAYRAVAVLPSVRGFKIAENQSPAPMDRIYYSFNYYDDLNQQVNRQLGSKIDHLKAYREILGFEKTFLDGRASFGMRLPIDTLSTRSTLPGFGGTTTSTGDLAAIFKYALIDDRDAGRLVSAGLLVSMPTGPRSFAGSNGIRSPHNAALQPFLGFIQSYGDLYFQGFSAIDVPMNPNDVTFYYNDIGAGYYIYRAQDMRQLITAIAPTFEVHINTPLNHRDPYNIRDIAGSYDFVDLTFGTNFQIRKRGWLTLAFVEPVTGPRPFTIEAIVQFNLRF